MTRKAIVVSAVAALLCLASGAWAHTGPPAENLPEAAPNTGYLGDVQPNVTYLVYDAGGDTIASVTQQVAKWDVDGDGVQDFFAYTYTVKNQKPGTHIIKYGFVEPWLAPIYATSDGSDYYNFGTGPTLTLFDVSPEPDGLFPVASPMPTWTVFAGTGAPGPGIPAGLSMDSGQGALSPVGPDKLYNFTIWWDHNGDLVADQNHTVKVSGPTPEPCTLGLLGLSGLAMIRLLRRKRE